jgi:hypothetical protein
MARLPFYGRVSKDARHVIRTMRSNNGYHRASVLLAQVAALQHAVNRRERPDLPLPGDDDGLLHGQRVRLGPEVHQLLERLSTARHIRVQQQLVREIGHSVRKRIDLHIKRSRAIRRARQQASGIAQRVRDRVRPAGPRRRDRDARPSPAGRTRVRTEQLSRHHTRTTRVPARGLQPDGLRHTRRRAPVASRAVRPRKRA